MGVQCYLLRSSVSFRLFIPFTNPLRQRSAVTHEDHNENIGHSWVYHSSTGMYTDNCECLHLHTIGRNLKYIITNSVIHLWALRLFSQWDFKWMNILVWARAKFANEQATSDSLDMHYVKCLVPTELISCLWLVVVKTRCFTSIWSTIYIISPSGFRFSNFEQITTSPVLNCYI